MNKNSTKNDSIFIKDIDDLNETLKTSDKSNSNSVKSNLSYHDKNVKIDYLNVPSPDMRFPVHRNNSLVSKKRDLIIKIDNYVSVDQPTTTDEKKTTKSQSFSNRKVLEKQKNIVEDHHFINILSATNSESKDYSSDDSNDSTDKRYGINSKESTRHKLNSNVSIVISPLSDEDDNIDQDELNTIKKEDEMQAKIDLSIFELLDHSSKKFILKPATMGLTIKSQVFRQKGLYPEYKFYLENLTDNLLLVMTARKRKKTKTTCYLISYISYDQTDVEKYIETPIAKLKSNLIGTQFLLYDFGIKPSRINDNKHLLTTASHEIDNNDNNLVKMNSFDTNFSSENGSNEIQLLSSMRKEYLSISYELNFFGYKGPRQMFIIIPGMDNDFQREDFVIRNNTDSLLNSWKKLTALNKTSEITATKNSSIKKRSSLTSQNSKKSNNEDQNIKTNVVKLVNNAPVWHEQYKSFALNFNGRVTQPSVKNYQVVHEVNTDYIVSQFGKVDTDLYTCDYSYPLCALQAFSIALSSLDNKLGCD